MNRAHLRGTLAALLSVILFASVVVPAAAQQVASAPAATHAAPAKTLVKAGAKRARWAPRARWGHYYYSRWGRAARWGYHAYGAKPAVKGAKAAWRPAVKIPTAASHPAAKPAAAAKLATAAALKAKPVAKAAEFKAKPAAKTAAFKAKPAAKIAAWAAPAAKKPAAKAASWVAAAAKNPAAKAAAHPSAASRPAVAAKPWAKAAARATQNPASHVKPAAANSGPAPLAMTRDANNGDLAAGSAAPIAGASQMSIAGQVGRTFGALVAVLLLVVAALFVLRRYKLVPAGGQSGARAPVAALGAKGFGSLFTQGASGAQAQLGAARERAIPGAGPQPLLESAAAALGDGGLQILGAQELPGSGASVYLLRIEDRMVLLGASNASGVRLLAEWEKDDTPEAGEHEASFEAFLREKAPPESEEHTFASIRARLNSTADRLAGLRAEFGA